MKVRVLVLFAAAFAVASAAAEEVPFKGRTLEVAADQEGRPITRMFSSQYGVGGSTAQILEKAQACLAGQQGTVVDSTDPATGLLEASSEVKHDAVFSSATIKSHLTMEAGQGYFRLTRSQLMLLKGETSVPLSQDDGDWDEYLEDVIKTENSLVDCMYR